MPGVIYGDYSCVIASESNMLKFLSRRAIDNPGSTSSIGANRRGSAAQTVALAESEKFLLALYCRHSLADVGFRVRLNIIFGLALSSRLNPLRDTRPPTSNPDEDYNCDRS
jgi:hypothetical protein